LNRVEEEGFVRYVVSAGYLVRFAWAGWGRTWVAARLCLSGLRPRWEEVAVS
jgi:hypothetical protein